jgi:hypothetical protein
VAIPLQGYAWRRVQNALGAWVEYATGLPAGRPTPADPPQQVAWADYDLGPLPHPYVTLQRMLVESLGRPDVDYGERAIEQRIVVTATVAGELVVVGLTWASYAVTVGVAATVTETRDALLALLVTTLEPLVFVADGADAIVVTPESASQICPAVAVQGCTVTDVTLVDVQSPSETKRYRVRVQIYGAPGDGNDSIDEYLNAMLQSLHDAGADGGLEFLHRYGVGVEGIPESAIDISALSGALRQRRLFFDVSFVCKSIVYRYDPIVIDDADPPAIVEIEN